MSELIERAHSAALQKIGQERLDGVGPNVDSYAAQQGINEALRVVLGGLQDHGLFGPGAPLPGWECAMPEIEALLTTLADDSRKD